MSQQGTPNHDLLSFQRLLAAAWVLQSQQDQAQSELNQLPEEAGDVPASAPGSDDIVNSQAHITVEPDTPQDYGPKPIDVPIPHSILQPSESLAITHNEENPELPSPTVARIRMQRLRGILTVVEPFLVLLIMFMFLLAEAWPREDRASAHVRETSPPRTDQTLVEVSSKTSVQAADTDSALAVRTPSNGPLRSTPSLQSSHMQVTDPVTSLALHDLSRYEIRTLRRQAKHGDAAAAFTLAMAYEAGHLVPQDCKKAAALVETSAAAGNVAAEYNLGLRYRFGDGIPVNANKAAKWLQRADGRGYPRPTLVVSAN